jgi:hypothetical protein
MNAKKEKILEKILKRFSRLNELLRTEKLVKIRTA